MEQCENHSLKEHFPQAPQKTFLSGDGCLLAKNHANVALANFVETLIFLQCIIFLMKRENNILG